ncbi:MAG: hypothetical protein HC917_20375 [Richelia sp. SM2_1_7]|nr:hypothetical protein [Richelia sp. SM2_1_7]
MTALQVLMPIVFIFKAKKLNLALNKISFLKRAYFKSVMLDKFKCVEVFCTEKHRAVNIINIRA